MGSTPSGDVTLPITAIVSTKNEERAIEQCLLALRHFEHVVVVDSNSDDSTVPRARALGATVIDFSWNGEYPKKKQWCLENLEIETDWVLFVDADERPPLTMISELHDLAREGFRGYAAFDISLDYTFAGRQLRHGHVVQKRALLNRHFCRFPEFNDLEAPGMGELEGHYQPVVVENRIGTLSARLLHDDPDPLSSWIARHNKYSDWEAYLRTTHGLHTRVRASRSRQGRLFDKVPFKPLAFFLYSFVVRRGFLDGRSGLDYSIALSFYYWMIGAKTRERNRALATVADAASGATMKDDAR